jgi:hypothetical protein
MWVPSWLYECLPLLYVAAGGACLWLLGTSFTPLLSALLLMAAAILTVLRRRNARRAQALRQARALARRPPVLRLVRH